MQKFSMKDKVGYTLGDLDCCFTEQFRAINYDLYNYQPFSNSKVYNNEVLIISGTEDKLVNDATCQSYLKCYNNEKTTYIQVEGGDHNFASIDSKNACENAIIDFCKLISNK